MKRKIVTYSRTSTGMQNNSNQTNELKAYIKNQPDLELAGVYEDVITGGSMAMERKGLSKILELASQNKIHAVAVSFIDRLGRDTIDVLKTIELLNQKKINLYVKHLNLWTLNPDGSVNAMGRLTFQLLAIFSEMEKNAIRARVKNSLQNLKNQGVVLGRPKGYKLSNDFYQTKYRSAIKDISIGISLRRVAKMNNLSLTTCQKLKHMIDSDPSL